MWPLFVINLAADRQRMQNAEAQLHKQGLTFARIEAVDGRALSTAQIARVYDKRANARRGGEPLVPAKIGCWLSHLEAWKRIAKGKAQGGIVLEDDFHAHPDFAQVVALVCHDAARDWDMVRLFSLKPKRRSIASRPLGAAHALVKPYKIPACVTGYAITQAAAAQLAARALPLSIPLDEELKRFWLHGLDIALVLPPPLTLGDETAAAGTIGAQREAVMRKESRKNPLGFALRRWRYQARYQCLVHYHRMRQSITGKRP